MYYFQNLVSKIGAFSIKSLRSYSSELPDSVNLLCQPYLTSNILSDTTTSSLETEEKDNGMRHLFS